MLEQKCLFDLLYFESLQESITNPVACDVISTCLIAEKIDLSLLEVRSCCIEECNELCIFVKVRNKILQLQKLRYSPQWYKRVPSLYKEVDIVCAVVMTLCSGLIM